MSKAKKEEFLDDVLAAAEEEAALMDEEEIIEEDEVSELDQLRAERDELRDRFMRALADAENARKRSEKDRREAGPRTGNGRGHRCKAKAQGAECTNGPSSASNCGRRRSAL